MTDLLGVATGSSGEASHNAGGMVMGMLRFYGQCLYVGLKLMVIWWAFTLLPKISYRPLRIAAWVVLAACVVFFMWHQSHIMHPLWVICVAGLVWIIYKGRIRAVAAWLGLFMLLVFRSPQALMVAAAMYGLCYALGTVAITMLTRDAFGPENYGRAYPIIGMGGNMANAVFSSVVGFMYDFSGGYTSTIIMMAAMLAASVAIALYVYASKARTA